MTTAADRLRALTTTTPLEVLGPIVFNQPTRCDLVVYRGDTGRFRVTVTDVAGDRSISRGAVGLRHPGDLRHRHPAGDAHGGLSGGRSLESRRRPRRGRLRGADPAPGGWSTPCGTSTSVKW
jgi:hypothetical protein